MAIKDCAKIRARLVDRAAGRLDPAAGAEVDAHLAGCESCRGAAAVEAALSDALARRLIRHQAPVALLQRLEARLADVPASAAAPAPSPSSSSSSFSTAASAVAPARDRSVRRRWVAPALAACAAAALTAVVTLRFFPGDARRHPRDAQPDGATLVAEVLTDHLRVVSSTHPLDVESGGIHQVKPWFTGRLDFAPRLGFSGDDDFPLLGGSIGYVLDRKAAVLVFKRRLHTITLLVFPPNGLAWPTEETIRVGRLAVVAQAPRGFSVLLWRDGDLGYALVSDASRAELETLAAKIGDSNGDNNGKGNGNATGGARNELHAPALRQ